MSITFNAITKFKIFVFKNLLRFKYIDYLQFYSQELKIRPNIFEEFKRSWMKMNHGRALKECLFSVLAVRNGGVAIFSVRNVKNVYSL